MFRAFMASLTFLIRDGVEIEDYDFHVPMGNVVRDNYADDDHQHQDGNDDEDDNEDVDEDNDDEDNDAGDDQQQQEEEDEDNNVEYEDEISDSDSSVVEDGVIIKWFVPSAGDDDSESK